MNMTRWKKAAGWVVIGVILVLALLVGYVRPILVRTNCDSSAQHSTAQVYSTAFDMKYPQMRDAYAGYYDACLHRHGM